MRALLRYIVFVSLPLFRLKEFTQTAFLHCAVSSLAKTKRVRERERESSMQSTLTWLRSSQVQELLVTAFSVGHTVSLPRVAVFWGSKMFEKYF